MAIFYSDYVTATDYDEIDALTAAEFIHNCTGHDLLLPHAEEHFYTMTENNQQLLYFSEKCFELREPAIHLNDELQQQRDGNYELVNPVYRNGAVEMDISKLKVRVGDRLSVRGIWGYGTLGPPLGPLAVRATIKSAPYLALPAGTYLLINNEHLLQKVGDSANDVYNIDSSGWVSAQGLPANDPTIQGMLRLTSAPFRTAEPPATIRTVAEGLARFYNTFRTAPASVQQGTPGWDYRVEAKQELEPYVSELRD